jgi:hypothetical protein
MLTSHHWTKCLISSTSPKVNIVKYIPLNLSVKAPMRKARQKLAKPPMRIKMGKNNDLLNIAEAYTPTPKNAAGASEM